VYGPWRRAEAECAASKQTDNVTVARRFFILWGFLLVYFYCGLSIKNSATGSGDSPSEVTLGARVDFMVIL
jgi:hypothetical protein